MADWIKPWKYCMHIKWMPLVELVECVCVCCMFFFAFVCSLPGCRAVSQDCCKFCSILLVLWTLTYATHVTVEVRVCVCECLCHGWWEERKREKEQRTENIYIYRWLKYTKLKYHSRESVVVAARALNSRPGTKSTKTLWLAFVCSFCTYFAAAAACSFRTILSVWYTRSIKFEMHVNFGWLMTVSEPAYFALAWLGVILCLFTTITSNELPDFQMHFLNLTHLKSIRYNCLLIFKRKKRIHFQKWGSHAKWSVSHKVAHRETCRLVGFSLFKYEQK